MSCPRYGELLWYADTGDREPLRGHAPDGCPRCAGRLAEYAALRAALAPLAGVAEGATAPADRAAAAALAARLAAEAGVNSPAGRVRALIAAARTRAVDDRQVSLRHAGEALALAHTLADGGLPPGLAETLLADAATAHGFALALCDQPDEAARQLETALERWRTLGDPLGEATALNSLAIARMMTREFAAAERAARSALRLTAELGDELRTAMASHNLAMIFGDLGRHADALRAARDAAAVFARHERPAERGRALHLAAWHLRELDRLAEAAQSAREARGLLAGAGDEVDCAKCDWVLGRIALRRDPAGPEVEHRLSAAHAVMAARGLWLEATLIRCDRLRALLARGDAAAAGAELTAIRVELPADRRNAWTDAALDSLASRLANALPAECVPLADDLASLIERGALATDAVLH